CLLQQYTIKYNAFSGIVEAHEDSNLWFDIRTLVLKKTKLLLAETTFYNLYQIWTYDEIMTLEWALQEEPETIIYLNFVHMVDYIDRFSYVEPWLHLWDEAYLIIVDDIFEVFLDSVCYYLIKNFCSSIHGDIGL
ncbi:hypothetical protein STEG23_030583, partial [Scotinomys teguina]